MVLGFIGPGAQIIGMLPTIMIFAFLGVVLKDAIFGRKTTSADPRLGHVVAVREARTQRAADNESSEAAAATSVEVSTADRKRRNSWLHDANPFGR